jgi:hypothetical protein
MKTLAMELEERIDRLETATGIVLDILGMIGPQLGGMPQEVCDSYAGLMNACRDTLRNDAPSSPDTV